MEIKCNLSHLSVLGDILLKPILQAAGTDISHWFNQKTKDVRLWHWLNANKTGSITGYISFLTKYDFIIIIVQP